MAGIAILWKNFALADSYSSLPTQMLRDNPPLCFLFLLVLSLFDSGVSRADVSCRWWCVLSMLLMDG